MSRHEAGWDLPDACFRWNPTRHLAPVREPASGRARERERVLLSVRTRRGSSARNSLATRSARAGLYGCSRVHGQRYVLGGALRASPVSGSGAVAR